MEYDPCFLPLVAGRGADLVAPYHCEINLTPTNWPSVHMTSQLRCTLASLKSTRVKVRGKFADRAEKHGRVPLSEMSWTMQRIGCWCPPKNTSASRRTQCR